MKTKKEIAEITKAEKNLLAEGNTYSFGHLILKCHEEICKEADFTYIDAVNHCRSRIDFNDGIYTLWGNNDVKYFFDCEMNFRGTKC